MRIPRLALVAWGLTLIVVAALVVAVVPRLGSEHMHMGAADVLARGGSGSPLDPLLGSALLTAWQLDAVSLAVLAVLAALYLTAVARVGSWPVRHTLAFFAGLAVCAFATCGSIAVYDQVLFTAHMAGHLALVMVAPALLMWGRPLTLLAAVFPGAGRVLRSRVVAVLTAPPVALAVYAAVIVGSHLTGLMDTIMRNTWAGQVEHLVYVLAGCLFFVLIVGDEPIRWKLGSPARWLLLAIAMAVDTFTGIVLMQGTHAVALRPSALDVDALSDTRTGGAIMWFGGDAIMAAIMIALVVAWLRHVDLAPQQGWLEQARRATFTSNTGSAEAVDKDIDSDSDAHDAYNEWLRRLDGQSTPRENVDSRSWRE